MSELCDDPTCGTCYGSSAEPCRMCPTCKKPKCSNRKGYGRCTPSFPETDPVCHGHAEPPAEATLTRYDIVMIDKATSNPWNDYQYADLRPVPDGQAYLAADVDARFANLRRQIAELLNDMTASATEMGALVEERDAQIAELQEAAEQQASDYDEAHGFATACQRYAKELDAQITEKDARIEVLETLRAEIDSLKAGAALGANLRRALLPECSLVLMHGSGIIDGPYLVSTNYPTSNSVTADTLDAALAAARVAIGDEALDEAIKGMNGEEAGP